MKINNKSDSKIVNRYLTIIIMVFKVYIFNVLVSNMRNDFRFFLEYFRIDIERNMLRFF